MTYTERARALRPYIVKASASLTDADALKAMELYDRWAAGMSVEVNDRLVYADRLYRVTQAHTTQEGPIPAAKGMEYTYGLYYTDPEDGKLYRCERTGEQPGGKVTLQFLPHELVGLYFTEV